MSYWLFKSEPTCFSIDDLEKCKDQKTYWDGIRNYQVRNLLRDTIKIGDKAFFYHSNAKPAGISGIMEIITNGYADFTTWDKMSEHYDPKCTPENTRWYMVDVRFVKKFPKIITLEQLKKHPLLKNMLVTRPGNRLSITPVTVEEWKIICNMC